MGHGSFRESSSPRSPHLAQPQAPEQQPQLSVSSITSHLARTQRRPGANSQLSSPARPPTSSSCPAPQSRGPAVSSSGAPAQTAGLPEEGRERFPVPWPTPRRPPQLPAADRRCWTRPGRAALTPESGGASARSAAADPRLLRGPQRLGPGGRRVHACLPAARAPGRRSAVGAPAWLPARGYAVEGHQPGVLSAGGRGAGSQGGSQGRGNGQGG